MSKQLMLLVITTADFMLMTPGGTIEPFRPSVVSPSHELNQFSMEGKVKVIANDLPEKANDADFAKFYRDHDNDTDTALENYRYSLEEDPEAAATETAGETETEKEASTETAPKAPAPKKPAAKTPDKTSK